MTNASKKTPRPAPLRQDAARKSSRSPLLLNLSDLDALPVNDWILPDLFLRSQVSALVGDKSTNKTSIAICLATMKAYGDPWLDGTPMAPGAVFYVAGEGLSGVRNRRRAALRALGKAEPERLADFFKVVDPRAATLNVLDADSVANFISAVREQIDREGLHLDIVFLDTLSALIGDESPKSIVTLIKHMRLIAESLSCHVCVLHHTQRGTSKYRGPGHLGGNLDGLFVAIKQTRERTLLFIEKQREGEAGFSFVFDRSVITLGVDAQSKPITSVAMTLGGTIADDDSSLNHDAYRRKQIADAMRPGQRLTVSAVVRLLKWSKDGYGGVQHGWVEDAIPEEEWIGVEVGDRTVRELRRSRRGPVMYIECRNAEHGDANDKLPEHDEPIRATDAGLASAVQENVDADERQPQATTYNEPQPTVADDHISGPTVARTRPPLEELRDAPLGPITLAESDAVRSQVKECNANHRLHALVGNDETITLAGAYRMQFFSRIDQLASVDGATLHPDAQQGIEAAKRIRAASWWVRHGPGKPVEIIDAANEWAAGRKAAKTAAGG
jgi:hypothetical protein